MQIPKKRKVGASTIPNVQTTAFTRDLKTINDSGRVTLEQVSTFKDLLQNIDNIEVISQIRLVFMCMCRLCMLEFCAIFFPPKLTQLSIFLGLVNEYQHLLGANL